LIVEIDGFAYHSDSMAYVRDRQRQNRIVLDGWRVLRFAATELTSRPRAVVAEVRAALEG
jgi:very-short-patch-repair endonuclease